MIATNPISYSIDNKKKLQNLFSQKKFAKFVYTFVLRAEKVTIFELKLPRKW